MSSNQVQEKQDARTRRMDRGCLLPLALFLIALPALPTVAYLVFTRRAAGRVEQKLAEIRAAGEPATAEEVNDYYQYPPADKDVTQLWLAATKPLDYDSKQYEEDCGELPIVGSPDEEKIVPPPGEAWEDLAAAEEFLAKYADSIELLHRAAEKSATKKSAAEEGGTARYPIDFSQGWDADTSCIQALRGGTHILALKAHVRAHHGDARGAAESIHAIFALGQSLETNPALVPQLVRKSIQSIACELLRELLPYVEFSDDELVTFRADIQKIDNDAGFERAFIGERAVSVSIFLDPASAGENDGGAVGILGARNDDLLLYLRVMEDNLDAIRKPWPRKLDDLRAVEEELNAYDSTISNIRYIMTMLLTPALGSTVAEAYAEGEANSRATDAALAVERFRRKTGRLPEKLDELVPEFLDEVPLDPFDGKPLRYSVREDAYVIHSIGPDRVDDGGQIVEEENEYGNDIDNPDIIFLVKRTKK